MEEFFYGTLPEDTQDFTQVLKGVKRSLGDVARGVSYYPYDLLGSGVDIANMALTPLGLGSERPVLGSDYLRNIAQSLGFAQPSTGSGAETAARFGAAFINPAAGARAVGQVPQAVTRGANVSADKLVQMITGNPQATAPRVLEETSMPFMQAMAPKTPAVPGLMEPAKSDIGFYSQLEAATIPLQNKGTGDQYLAQIQKSAGVKPEEIQWTGLDDFLKGKKSVTKAEIQDYLNANRVDVQEVRLGGTMPEVGVNPDSPYAIPEVLDVFQREGNAGEGFRVSLVNDYDAYMALERQFPDLLEQDEWADVVANSLFPNRQQVTPTKFSSKTLPGGENYREILLTLPIQPKGTNRYEVRPRKTPGESSVFDTEANKVIMFGRDAGMYQEAERLNRELAGTQLFKSTHFDQPNILAHMRVNDRVVDGKKTLFIEEVQSDWHQAGRKKGYDTPEARAAEQQKLDNILVERQALLDEQRRLEELAQPFTSQGKDAPREIVDQWSIVSNRLNNLQTEQNRLGRGFGQQVPDAPFKTSWHELTLKRAIQEASEKGYDQIAFTTGKTQVERYPEALRQVADNISWKSSGTPESGNRFIEIKKSGNTVLQAQIDSRGVVTSASNQEAVGKPIEDLIGKPMGQQVVSESSGSIKGEQFTVGGKGMEGFYDQILPKSLEKLSKKFDAKVGKTFIEGERTRDADGFPSMYPEKIEVWKMDITPKMRESVTTKGQPLFAVPAVGAGLLGAGMYQDEQMY